MFAIFVLTFLFARKNGRVLENYQKAPKSQNIQKFSIFDSCMQFSTVFFRELFLQKPTKLKLFHV